MTRFGPWPTLAILVLVAVAYPPAQAAQIDLGALGNAALNAAAGETGDRLRALCDRTAAAELPDAVMELCAGLDKPEPAEPAGGAEGNWWTPREIVTRPPATGAVRPLDVAIMAIGGALMILVLIVLIRGSRRAAEVASVTRAEATGVELDRFRLLGWIVLLSLLASSGLAYLEAGIEALINQWHQLTDITMAAALGTLLAFGLDLAVLRSFNITGLILGDYDETIAKDKQVALICSFFALWIVCIYIAAFAIGIND